MTTKFDEKLAQFGSTPCTLCDLPFSPENPCWNDDGCSEDGYIHIDGVCQKCANKLKCIRCLGDGRCGCCGSSCEYCGGSGTL